MALDSGKKMRKPATGDAASNGYGRTGKMKSNMQACPERVYPVLYYF